MTSERDFDRLARAWLDLGPDEAPDRVIAAVLQAADTTPQVRRRGPRPFRRSNTMTRYVAAAGLAAALILAIGGGMLLTGSSKTPAVVAPSTVPTPSATTGASIPRELQARWMGGHKQPFGADAGSTILIDANAIALSQSNSNDQAILSADASSAGEGRMRLEQADPSTILCHEGDAGDYSWSLSAGGRILTIQSVSDACAARPGLLTGTWWRMDCADKNDNCLGNLEAGTYASQFITPRLAPGAAWQPVFGALSYTVPAGWANSADWPSSFTLLPSRDYDGTTADTTAEIYHGIYVLTDPAISAQDLACSATDQAGVG
ncbi:MAG TPA: hypothetical protein VHR64_15510, partial [Thermomicrobiales bacterium]|nr:hypothetical protein [Thermomicrobiales bacterium]